MKKKTRKDLIREAAWFCYRHGDKGHPCFDAKGEPTMTLKDWMDNHSEFYDVIDAIEAKPLRAWNRMLGDIRRGAEAPWSLKGLRRKRR